MGKVLVDWSNTGITRVILLVRLPTKAPDSDAPAFVKEACNLIKDHLSGKMTDFSDIPLDLGQTSPFFKKVLNRLRDVSRPGQTMTYGELAAAAGSSGGARATGSVMARNPVPLIVPCHRVVAASGPGGYSAGDGLETKLGLLELERRSVGTSDKTGGRR